MIVPSEIPDAFTCSVHLADALGPNGLATLSGASASYGNYGMGVHAIFDAPYSAEVDAGQAVSGTRRGRVRQQVVRKTEIGVGYLTDEQISDVIRLCINACNRWIIAFCAWEQLHTYRAALIQHGGRYVRCCAWEKPDATPQLSGDRPATWGECMVVGWASEFGRLRWHGGGKRGLYKAGVCRGHERSDHPTQKPLQLMREIIDDFTDPKDLIIDPFAGSGSTLVAARQLGRSSIGFEKNPEYHAIAQRRIAGERARLNEFQPELFGSSTNDPTAA